MTTYEAPAKLNLSLLVYPPRPDGYHPIESLVQTVEWCDLLHVEPGQEGTDTLHSEIEDNLVERALHELRKTVTVPPLDITLGKMIPVAAGLGGGSSDAAAALMAGADASGASASDLADVASRVGADVSLFLTGGTVMMSGVGEVVEVVRAQQGFACAVVVPEFGLSTEDVYRHWDAMEGPEGDAVDDGRLPPSLRGGMPLRNDLLPAALDLEPRLGDFMSDLTSVWGVPVCLTGSGTACFSYHATLDEAADAVVAAGHLIAEGRGVALRDHGVSRSRGATTR